MWPIAVLLAGVVLIVWLAVLGVVSHRPVSTGIRTRRLSGCPESPNCVSSEAHDTLHAIEPIRFKGDAGEALRRLIDILAATPRTRIVVSGDNYIHAEATSLIFRFVDDVEFLVDAPNHAIHCRSAARVGHGDFGVNRRRLERIRAAFSKLDA